MGRSSAPEPHHKHQLVVGIYSEDAALQDKQEMLDDGHTCQQLGIEGVEPKKPKGLHSDRPPDCCYRTAPACVAQALTCRASFARGSGWASQVALFKPAGSCSS
jgi:hypothetical protein